MTRLAPSSPEEAEWLVRLQSLDASLAPHEFELTRRLARLRGVEAENDTGEDDGAERISSTMPLGSSPRLDSSTLGSGAFAARLDSARLGASRLGAAERSFGRRPSWMRRLVMVAAAPLLFGGFAFAWELQRVLVDSFVDAPPEFEEPREPAQNRPARRARPTATLTLPPPAEVPEPAEELQAPAEPETAQREAPQLEALSLDALPTETSEPPATKRTTATDASSPPTPTATWGSVAAAMRNGDTTSALRDLDRLVAQTRGKDREAAELARAQLWLTTGNAARAHESLTQLATRGRDPLVRSRAAQLLGIPATATP